MGSPRHHAWRGLFILLATLAGVLAHSSRLAPSLSSTNAEVTYVTEQAGSPGSSVVQPASDIIEAADTMQLSGLEGRFEEIAKSVGGCVVAISACDTPAQAGDPLRADDMNGEKLANILDRTTRTVGTGFFIDSDGYILTNEHVVGTAEQLWVTTDQRKVYPAIVVGSDPRADLAVLKIPGGDFPAARFAGFNTVKRGQWTIVLGNPYGLAAEGEMAMSVGVVSATDRSLPKLSSKENRLYTNLIQTTAEINPGNSGGPLFDLDGNVIGISTAVILPQKKTNGIGFAIPITPALVAQVQELRAGREIVYGYVGVIVGTPTSRERRTIGVNEEVGVRIESIESDSPASSSLEPKDLIIQINGELIRNSDHFVRVIGSCPAGKAAKISIFRNGKPTTVEVTPRKRNLPSVAITRENQRLRWRGMLLGPVPNHWTLADPTQPRGGLMVLNIDTDSPMRSEGVAQGTVITSIAGKSVSNIEELQEVLNETPVEQCKLELLGAKSSQVVSLDQ